MYRMHGCARARAHTHTHTHNAMQFYRHRGKGKTVLWNPGCDHAGIATQVSYSPVHLWLDTCHHCSGGRGEKVVEGTENK